MRPKNESPDAGRYLLSVPIGWFKLLSYVWADVIFMIRTQIHKTWLRQLPVITAVVIEHLKKMDRSKKTYLFVLNRDQIEHGLSSWPHVDIKRVSYRITVK